MAFRQISRANPLLARAPLFRAPIALRPVPTPRIAASAFSTSIQRLQVKPSTPPEELPKGAEVIVPKPYVLTRWRRFLRNFGRGTLVVLLTATGAFLYVTQRDVNPGDQLPADPEKPTLVVLGSGWGATSFLKTLDTEEFNVVVISPRNYFLFTPLLPSVTVGTLEPRSIIQPTRYITRHKKRKVDVYEAEAQEVDPIKKTVTFQDMSDIRGAAGSVTIPYDYLVYAVGCENQTFGIKGVPEYACFLKELSDADKVRTKLLDCIETAAFKNQPESEIDRLMHMVVVGGGPTGVEYAGELHDFLIDDLKKWYPEIADRLRITLIEALPNVLPAFSKQLIQYTESTFAENKIDVLTRTMVKDVKERSVVVQDANKEIREIPYGLLVWATGNTSRNITRDLMGKLTSAQTQRRGLLVDDYLRLLGADGVYAVGDCTATQYAPTAQVASQQGIYLAQLFGKLGQKAKLERQLAQLRSQGDVGSAEIEGVVKKLNRVSKLTEFHYSHQGSLAYIGSEKAIADLPFFNNNLASGGGAAMLFWRSAYISTLYSVRNRTLVLADWAKVKIFGRDVSRE
ncbi:putative NADH dehydrogenase [Naematelia encephala]|uniref:NADH:ubiquinone reductase (non-electrogenic) n=1 Tax=Naematelia encephala TaxID=71784 RepID=A0A1Y2B489_9TREE|nr:putative NADH dehydrogenase [Naematelia encephala]